MDTTSYKTISANKATANKKWFIVDAKNEPLGRMASKVAFILRGKHKTNFTPHADCGDYVIVINASQINLSGKKWDEKEYITYSGYPGGQKTAVAKDVMAKKPTFMVEKAIKGMLPKNRLGSAIAKNLHVFEGDTHPHEAQQPETLNLAEIK